MHQHSIMVWTPDVVVHTIKNTAEGVGPIPQKAIEAHTLLRRENFLSIAWAYGGELLRELKASLHKRDLVVKLQAVHAKKIGCQAQLIKIRSWKESLIGQVVNREDCGCLGRISCSELAHVDWGQAGVPVMAMHNIGLPGTV